MWTQSNLLCYGSLFWLAVSCRTYPQASEEQNNQSWTCWSHSCCVQRCYSGIPHCWGKLHIFFSLIVFQDCSQFGYRAVCLHFQNMAGSVDRHHCHPRHQNIHLQIATNSMSSPQTPFVMIYIQVSTKLSYYFSSLHSQSKYVIAYNFHTEVNFCPCPSLLKWQT